MKNYNQFKKHIIAHYKKARAAAAKADSRLDARGVRVAMTPAGLRAELRRLDREEAAAVARLDAAAAAPVLDHVSILVDWSRSAVWGWCPKACATIEGAGRGFERRESRRVTGCGYDKESAAVAHALECSAMYDRFVFENWRRAASKDHPCYYGPRWVLPFLEISGCGVDVLRRFAERAGYVWSETHSKSADAYTITRKGCRHA